MTAAFSAAVLHELQNPAPVGKRHAQVVRLAPAMLSAGLSNADVFHRLRKNYDRASLPDAEIYNVLRWAQKKILPRFARLISSTQGFGQNLKKTYSLRQKGFGNNPKTSAGDIFRAINSFLEGFSFDESDWFDASPIRLPIDFRNDAELVFESLYYPCEKLNIVTRFREEKPTGKTSPLGFGLTLTRNEWLDRFRKKPIPETQAGAWFRINPVNGIGVSDGDISKFRFALIESDLVPIETQLSLLAKLPLPICAIVKSGGKSIHAWVRISEKTLDDYRKTVGTLFSRVGALGFDTSNRNPSRLSRLPGAQRTIGAIADGKQRLLYLNPNATERSIA